MVKLAAIKFSITMMKWAMISIECFRMCGTAEVDASVVARKEEVLLRQA